MLYFDKQNFKTERSWHSFVTHTNKCLQNLEAPSTGHILQTSKTASYLPVIFKKPQNRAKNFHSGSPMKIFITKKRNFYLSRKRSSSFNFLPQDIGNTFLKSQNRLFYTNAILKKPFRVSSVQTPITQCKEFLMHFRELDNRNAYCADGLILIFPLPLKRLTPNEGFCKRYFGLDMDLLKHPGSCQKSISNCIIFNGQNVNS